MTRLLLLTAVCLAAGSSGAAGQVSAASTQASWSFANGHGIATNTPGIDDDWWNAFRDPTLTSLVARAVNGNLDLAQAASRVNEARSGVRSARSAFLPQINANTSAARERIRAVAAQSRSSYAIVPVEINNFQGTFDASWELDLFGRIRYATKAARNDLAAADEDRHDVLLTLVADVARIYSDLRGSQLRLHIAQQNIDVDREEVTLTGARSDAGLATEFDVARANAQLEAVRAQVPALQSEIAKDIHRLGVLLGLSPIALQAELAADVPLPPIPPSIPAGVPSDVLERRPDIRRSGAQLRAQAARIGQARADYFPRLTLTGEAGRAGNQLHDLTLGGSNIFSVGPSISLPVFTAGRIRANVDLQRERADEASLRYRQSVLTAFEETENALIDYADEQDRHARLVLSAHQQQTALDLAQVQYKAGLTDFLTILDAERQLYLVQDQAAQSSTAIVVDAVALFKALGGGWTAAETLQTSASSTHP